MKSIGSEVLSISSSLPCSETSKGIGFLNRNGNSCKKPQVGKLLRELKSAPMCVIKKVHWFLSMSVTASLLRLGALLRDKLQIGAFF